MGSSWEARTSTARNLHQRTAANSRACGWSRRRLTHEGEDEDRECEDEDRVGSGVALIVKVHIVRDVEDLSVLPPL